MPFPNIITRSRTIINGPPFTYNSITNLEFLKKKKRTSEYCPDQNTNMKSVSKVSGERVFLDSLENLASLPHY